MKIMNNILKHDDHWSKEIFRQDFGKPLNYLCYFFSTIFMEESAFLVVIWVYFLLGRSLQLYILYLITFVANILVTVVSKKFFARPRPTNKDFPRTSKSLFFRNKQSNHSLPSGDTMQAVNLAWFLCIYGNSNAFLLFIPVCLMVAYSRVYLCCHYISDTIIGGLLAISTTSLIILLGANTVDYSRLLSRIF